MNKITSYFGAQPLLLLIAGILSLSSCAIWQSEAQAIYGITFGNKTGHGIDGVSFKYGATERTTGILTKGAIAGEGLFSVKIPTEAKITWKDDGQMRNYTVQLKGVVPDDFKDGTLYFIINQDGTVEVRPIKDGDDAAVDKLYRELRPYQIYNYDFVNRTGRAVSPISLYTGDVKIGTSIGSDGVHVGNLEQVTNAIPSEVTLRWRERDKEHVVVARLDGIVPKDYDRGTIYFVIKPDDSLDIKTIRWADEKARSKLLK